MDYEKYNEIFKQLPLREKPAKWLELSEDGNLLLCPRLLDLVKDHLVNTVKKHPSTADEVVLCCVKASVNCPPDCSSKLDSMFRDVYSAMTSDMRNRNPYFWLWWSKVVANTKKNDAAKISAKAATNNNFQSFKTLFLEVERSIKDETPFPEIPLPPELQKQTLSSEQNGDDAMDQSEVRQQLKQLHLNENIAPNEKRSEVKRDDSSHKMMALIEAMLVKVTENEKRLKEMQQTQDEMQQTQDERYTKIEKNQSELLLEKETQMRSLREFQKEQLDLLDTKYGQLLTKLDTIQSKLSESHECDCLPVKKRRGEDFQRQIETTACLKTTGVTTLELLNTGTGDKCRSAVLERTKLNQIAGGSAAVSGAEFMQIPMDQTENTFHQTVKQVNQHESVWEDPENPGSKMAPKNKTALTSFNDASRKQRAFGPKKVEIMTKTECNNDDTSTPDTSPMLAPKLQPPKFTSTPFEKGLDQCNNDMPTLNVSVIPRGYSLSAGGSDQNRCSLSTVAEEENEHGHVMRSTNGNMQQQQQNCRSSTSSSPTIECLLGSLQDPFSTEALEFYFRKLNFPASGEGIRKVRVFNKYMPQWVPGKETNCGLNCSFMAGHFIDSGKFGKVFKLEDAKGAYAAKMQSPPFPWEICIMQLLRDRLNDLNLVFDLKINIQEPRSFYSFKDGGILVSKLYNEPTMLSFQNNLSKKKLVLTEVELIILLVELILIMENMHKVDIIHGDLKPDNIMMRVPNSLPQNRKEFFTKELCFMILIDFGKGIDMSMFPKNHKFTSEEAASNFKCVQMIEKKPWSYELDIFCIAATVHVLMFGKYMTNLTKDRFTGLYKLYETPKRSFNRELWNSFYQTMINSAYKTAMLPTMRDMFMDYLYKQYDDNEIRDGFYNLNKLICEMN